MDDRQRRRMEALRGRFFALASSGTVEASLPPSQDSTRAAAVAA
jgi:hypothetical protein